MTGVQTCALPIYQFDPWRLPAIQTENIALRFPRPDQSVATGPIGGTELLTEGNPNNAGDSFFIDLPQPEKTTAGESGDIKT